MRNNKWMIITVRKIFHTQIEVIRSFAIENARESNDIYNKREMEVTA